MRNGKFSYVSDAEFRRAVAPGGEGLAALAKAHGTDPDHLGIRAAFTAEVKADGDLASRSVDIVISTDSVDRDRDIISVDGWDLAGYRRNPVVLFAHDYYSLPVARGENVRTEDGKLKATANFVPAEIYPFAETVYQMLAGGWISGASVGFRAKVWQYNEERRGVDFSSQELLEFSIVPVPANSECLVEARAAGVDTEPLREWAERTLVLLGQQAEAAHGANVGARFDAIDAALKGFGARLDAAKSSRSLRHQRAEEPSDVCPKGGQCPMGAAGDAGVCPAMADCPMGLGERSAAAGGTRKARKQDEPEMDVPGVIVLLADIASDVSDIAPLLSSGSEARLYEAVGRLVDVIDDAHDARDALLEAAEEASGEEEQEPGSQPYMSSVRRAAERKGAHSGRCDQCGKDGPIEVGVCSACRRALLQRAAKGVSPSDASTAIAPADTAWSAPALSDFTSEQWGDLSTTEQRHIAGHYAWAASMPPAAFGDLKLPHHRPSDAKVVWRGVAAAAGRLGQASIPSDDVSAVKAHLAKHYRAFDKTPPWEANAAAWDAVVKGAAPDDAALAAALRTHGFAAEAEAVAPKAEALDVLVLDAEVIDLDAIQEDDELAGVTASDFIAALRETISAEAHAGVRRALNGALGRVD